MSNAHARRSKTLPFLLTGGIVAADQISKIVIDHNLQIGEKVAVIGDFLWLWHVRNRGMAFSVGSNLSPGFRDILFLLLPAAVLTLLLVYYFRSTELGGVQRWCFAAILGGGLGNLLDRLLRPEGVVDFVSVKFYGLFGMERYPTFNLADASVVVAGITMILSYIAVRPRRKG